jgi:cobalamin biosynthesis protein CobT
VATGSDKIFTRKVFRQHKDYKVTLLVDESGSMTSDNKNFYATLGCVLMAEVLAGSNIDFEIIGFNGTIRVYKKF